MAEFECVDRHRQFAGGGRKFRMAVGELPSLQAAKIFTWSTAFDERSVLGGVGTEREVRTGGGIGEAQGHGCIPRRKRRASVEGAHALAMYLRCYSALVKLAAFTDLMDCPEVALI